MLKKIVILSAIISCCACISAENGKGSGTMPGVNIPAKAPVKLDGMTRANQELDMWKLELEKKRRALTGGVGAANTEEVQKTELLKALTKTAAEGTKIADASELMEQISTRKRELMTIVKELQDWENNINLEMNDGRVDSMIARADAFAIERQYRRQLQEKVKDVFKTIQLWEMMELASLIQQKERIDSIKNNLFEYQQRGVQEVENTSSKSPNANLGLADYEYYEVKKKADLKAISALPEVYGNSSYWEILYQANLEKVKSPDSIVEVGTVLLVPMLKESKIKNFHF